MRRDGLAGHVLRISAVGSPTCEARFWLGFEPDSRPGDVVVEQQGIRIVVDAATLARLDGIAIDYVSSLHGAGFKFVRPGSSHACGCGGSHPA